MLAVWLQGCVWSRMREVCQPRVRACVGTDLQQHGRVPSTAEGRTASLGGRREEEGNKSPGFGSRRCWEETFQGQKCSLGRSPSCGGRQLGFGIEKG